MNYDRNYGSADEPLIVEMVEIGPHQFVRRDVAASLGLPFLSAPRPDGQAAKSEATAERKTAN